MYLAGFLVRRSFRIIPVFWFAVILGCVYTERFLGENISVVHVIFRMLMLDPLLPLGFALGNSPLYTVVIEFWLYVIYGLVLQLNLEQNKIMLFGIVITAAITPPLLTRYFGRVWCFTNVLAFLPLWFLGAICAEIKSGEDGALIKRLKQVFSTKKAFRSSLAISILLLVAITYQDRYSLIGGGLRYVNQFAFAITIMFVLVNGCDFKAGVLMMIAEISYSLYAYHMPIMGMMRKVFHESIGRSSIILVLSSVFFAFGMYRLVEKPFQEYGKILDKRIRLKLQMNKIK